MKYLRMLPLGALVVPFVFLASCAQEADVVSRNLSIEADNFKVPRRLVFYNGRTDVVMLEIRGLCSIGNHDAAGEVTITCKDDKSMYRKHFLQKTRDITMFAEQLDSTNVSARRYKVTFTPAQIIPDIDIK